MYADDQHGRFVPSTDEDVENYVRRAMHEDEQNHYGNTILRPRTYHAPVSDPSEHLPPYRLYAGTRESQALGERTRLSLPPSAPLFLDTNHSSAYRHMPSASDIHTREYAENRPRDHRQPFLSVLPSATVISTAVHRVHHQGSSSSPVNAPSSSAFQASQRQLHPDVILPSRSYTLVKPQQRQTNMEGVLPIVQGIQLVPVRRLPDRFRSIFPFTMFNAVQSACFESLYSSDDNCVFSSPTGSGKTVLFELAICRILCGWENGSFKVVYMAPTKSLCSERTRDWKAKFEPLTLKCEEMTGDSDGSSLYHVQRADIIVTTPEKWDSMTRKWKDHERLVRLIKLLLIDEVHILSKDRGAALEVVVSRMKSIGSGIRFVALSATVPNSQDIATWLGRNDRTPSLPATHKRFGEEFRPVELKRHVCGYQSNANAFGFDSILTKKLSNVVAKYSQKKPIMVFCFTRKSCLEAAKFLANWWRNCAPPDRYWDAPGVQIKVGDKALQDIVTAGVAIHHAGLDQDDRSAVERAYLTGDLSVICCTSTLAVGVNLPCHMVIIKNTVSYEAGTVKEYSDLEIMQMIGRAGRPQFDASALAVIMTKMQQVKHYEQLLSGKERLESCLHLNLVEHLNAEIGLGMAPDLCAAKKWLGGTFLRVRLEANPTHYRIGGDSPDQNLDARLEQICKRAVSQLEKLELVQATPTYKSTEYGDAMARYYMNIATMELILSLPRKPKISEILTAISQAHEFRELRFRSGEKPVYKELNDMPGVRFPVKVDLSAVTHKVSLIIQSVLGGVSHITDQPNHRIQYNIDQSLIFQHVHRLIRCIVDCQSFSKDAIGIRNALMLSRSLAARVWDDSPMVLQQIEQIGPVALRKLVSARITTMEEFATTEPGRLELILNKAPPSGWNIHSRVQEFPKLRVSLQMSGQTVVKAREHVAVKLKVDLGFLNDSAPTYYRNKPVFVIVLIGTSDGQKISFFRVSAKKLERVNPINATAYLTSPTQSVECYVMCDDLAGTMQQAVLKTDLPTSVFHDIKDTTTDARGSRHASTRLQNTPDHNVLSQHDTNSDKWDDGGLNDDELMRVEPQGDDYVDIDTLSQPKLSQSNKKARKKVAAATTSGTSEGQRLENGKLACNHPCKDKTACKHQCCKQGIDKRPKARKPKVSDTSTATNDKVTPGSLKKVQSNLGLPFRSKAAGQAVEYLDLSQATETPNVRAPATVKDLTSLHDKTTGSSKVPILGAITAVPASSVSGESSIKPRFSQSLGSGEDVIVDEPPLAGSTREAREAHTDELLPDDEDYLDRDEDMLDAALVGLEDSASLQNLGLSRFRERCDTGTDCQYEEVEPELSMIPRVSQVDSGSEKFWGANGMFNEDSDDLSLASPCLVKRKHDEDIASSYFSAKKARIRDEADSHVDKTETQGDEDDEECQDIKKKREAEELRAWLAAEFGDSVEMV